MLTRGPHKNDESEKLVVFDGIVDKENFSKAGLLFLLKEAVEKSLRYKHEKSIKDKEGFDIIDLNVIAKLFSVTIQRGMITG